jgi:hypothetical protein
VGSIKNTKPIINKKNIFKYGCISFLSLSVITKAKYTEKIKIGISKIGVICQPNITISLYADIQSKKISSTQRVKNKHIAKSNLLTRDFLSLKYTNTPKKREIRIAGIYV